ncbi:MAG: Cytosolic seryl-tRNA synthetase [Bogoriella megaspora]|nr:MAG: Cytosolic seryl-tRNA synthetase [Bogoriella megaspora]
MLDLLDFVADKGGNPEKIRDTLRKRYEDPAIVDDVIAAWEDHRKTQYAATQFGSQINEIQKQIGKKKKAKESADAELAQKVQLEEEKAAKEKEAVGKLQTLRLKAKVIGNYVHDSVPVSNDEANNRIERTWAPEGFDKTKKVKLSHHEVVHRLGGFDQDRGVKIAGHRAYCLMDNGVLLCDALKRYAWDHLLAKDFKLIEVPFMMSREAMGKTAQLSQFDEELYKVTEDGTEATDKYLIATAEQPLSAIHQDEWFQAPDLPVKYAGYSWCFRKEAGSHGKETWGLFRIHQFEKVEQFIFCKPDDSWNYLEEMIANAEEYYKSLNIPFQVISIVSGALNNAAAKKYDLEAWFPFQSEYKELVSASNCTDYQTRELEIRYGVKTKTATKKVYAHALNATLCAIQRSLCCVLENYQEEDGVRVPEVLRDYMPKGRQEFLPYVKELPKDAASQKGKIDGTLPIR